MPGRPFSTNPPYLESLRGLHRLHALTIAGQDETPEAELIRDRLESPWYRLSAAEKSRLNGLSEDLYSLSDELSPGVPTNPQVQRKLAEAVAAQQAGEWDRALELLRRWGKYVDPLLLASYGMSLTADPGNFGVRSRRDPEAGPVGWIEASPSEVWELGRSEYRPALGESGLRAA